MTTARSLVVLDTSVVSLFLRDAEEAAYYRSEIDGLRAVISFQTREEALFGAIRGGWGARRLNTLQQHLDQYEMVGASIELVDISANLRAERERAGRRLNTADAWIASTAIMLDCPLASHDGDFAGIPDLQIIRTPSS
ncbi:MAG: type II toxin-antitoxin system VapC family toxin [Gammaproteobacteria bacterium]|nr:type II toxin-antitoxin system VapC family toxin [Chloroflexota bacterium]MYK68773.1 type II toxin-antitoxin system VapC family toxin [Gammaproteobacteria bacterium]